MVAKKGIDRSTVGVVFRKINKFTPNRCHCYEFKCFYLKRGFQRVTKNLNPFSLSHLSSVCTEVAVISMSNALGTGTTGIERTEDFFTDHRLYYFLHFTLPFTVIAVSNIWTRFCCSALSRVNERNLNFISDKKCCFHQQPETEEEIKLIGFWLDSSAASEGLPNWLVAITWHIRKFQNRSLKSSSEITGRIHKNSQRFPKLTHFLRFHLGCYWFSMSWSTKTTNPFSLSMKFARKGGCRHAIIVVCAWLHVIVLWKETFCFRNLKQFLSCLI